TKDCSQDGHFGYAYLDAECQPLIIQRDSNLLCNPDTVHLSAPSGFAGYLWSTGETTQSIDASKKGVYTVTCRTVTNCEVRLAIEILYEKPPIPNFTWKYECKDSTMTFTDASQELEGNKITKWKWYFGDGDSSSVKNPVHKYTYSDSMKVVLILETAGGCSADTMIIVPVDVYMPQGPINALDTIKLCEKQTLNLYADSIPLSKYEWKGPSGFGSTQIKPVKVNILPKDSGWYRVKVDIRDGCKILNDSTWVVVEPLKIPFITPDTIICQGDTAKLYCGGGKTYLWTPSDSLSSTTAPLIRAWPDQTTMYTVNMFNDLCPDEVRQVEVRVLSGVVSMQMPDTLRSCIGGSIQLQASVNGFDVFRWNGPNGYQSTQNLPLITGMNTSKTGYYKLNCSISNNICLTGSDSTYLDLYPDPVVTISPRPAVICAGDSIQLTATGAVSYVWTPNQFISRPNISNPWFKPPASRKYTVEGTSIDGCLGYDTITIRVNPLPAPNLGPDKYFCLGDTGYVKIAGTYDSVLWFNGVTIDSVMVTTDTTVSITVYRNGCVGYDTMRVFFQDPGLFTLGPDTLLCETQAYYTNIQLNSVDSTLWNDGDKNLNRNIDSAGTYSVIIWAGQCIYRDTIVVLFDSIPVFSLGPDQTVCTGTSVTLSAIPVPAHGLPMTYSWSTGPANTGPSITVNATGNYSATINSSRCTYTDNVVVTVVVPQIPQPGPDQSICRGDSATFVSEVTGDAYVWNTSATTQSITVKNAATYIVSIAIGPCVVRDTFQLHVQIPTPINLGPDSTLCENERMLIIGPLNFDTYSWSSGESTRNIRVSESGLYTLTAVKGLCTSTDDIRITFDTIPHFTIENDSICENSTAVFTAPLTGDAYLWSTGDITPSITVSQADNYWLTITNGKCTFTDTAELVVERAPALNIGNDSIVCVGTGVRYGHFIPAARYLWNTEGQDTTPYIDAKGDKSNLYSVVVKYRFCEMRDSVRLVVTQMPQPDLGPDRLICEGTSVNLFANTFGERFDWNTPIVNGSSATVSEAGMYKVIITNGRCENSDSVVVRVQPKHEVILPPDIQICSNEKYDIVPVTDCQAPIYEWSNGGSGESITVRKSGTYTLKVSNGVCEAIDEIVVTVVPLPDVEPINTVLCPEDSLPLDLPAAYKYYHQSDMSPFTATNLYPQMEYNLFIIDSNGCRWTTHFWAELNMDCDRSIYIPNSFTPNGDGKNDLFKVEINDLKFVEMR
ncbi:MAG: PKD domain-containing protein, partial [Bacteroidota bacterium]